MLQLYLGETPEKIVKFNDAWFTENENSLQVNSKIEHIIKTIDDIEYIGKNKVYAKYEKDVAIGISEISTGCKAAINIANYPNKIFTVAECGRNSLNTILKYKKGKIYVPHFFIVDKFDNGIEVIIDNKNKIVIHNNYELEKVMNKYFEEE